MHKEILEKRNEVKKGLYSWYRFERSRKKQIFDAKEKIVVPYRDRAVINLVDIIISDKKTNSRIHKLCEHVIDAIIFELYFSAHMKERKIDVLQFVKKGIDEVLQDKSFETLNNTQKEQAITELHTRWSDPGSEIVKRMNSFPEKSPEILKPILEA